MKKTLALFLALLMLFALTACGHKAPTSVEEPSPDPVIEPETETPAEEVPAEEEAPLAAVTNYADFMAAEDYTPVEVETYVQDTQSWWNDQITVYTQNQDGAFFVYNMACSQEDAAKLVPGQKILVKGDKGTWAGEVEIVDASFEFVDGDSFVAEPLDVTDLLGTEELAAHQNEKVTFNGLTIVAKDDGESAFYRGWDNSGEAGSDADLYFDASINGETYTFVIEYYLRNEATVAYQAVENLKVDDVVDLEGFLYWYEGAQPHITSVTVK